ncbi:MAG: FRG domain-containing protein [Rhodomicrobium sp.]|nr:FRG domain-containing protein [Rhodomicrobium sp.]
MSIASVGDFLSAVADPVNKLGLHGTPANPWYLGQPDLRGDPVPAFYKSGIRPELEREVLRDFRQMSAEFAPTTGLADWQILISAHLAGVPSRIIEWSGNPLVALFLAAESMSADAGRVWVLNPWEMNQNTANLAYVPPVESGYFLKYTVKLDAPDAATPEAAHPMAFRPTRTTRTYNTQNIYWTVHGKNPAPLNELSFFMKRADAFMTAILVPGESKKAIMKELHDIGITRANLFPGAASLARTLAYRYSKNYLGG